MTTCESCKWGKKAGIFNGLHCFAPCWTRNAEQIHDWMQQFIGVVGCNSFEESKK